MTYNKEYIYKQQHEYAGSNQHGDRFKKAQFKRITVGKLSCDCIDTDGLQRLVFLSNILDVPVRYDFDVKPQQAFIRIVGQENL